MYIFTIYDHDDNVHTNLQDKYFILDHILNIYGVNESKVNHYFIRQKSFKIIN